MDHGTLFPVETVVVRPPGGDRPPAGDGRPGRGVPRAGCVGHAAPRLWVGAPIVADSGVEPGVLQSGRVGGGVRQGRRGPGSPAGPWVRIRRGGHGDSPPPGGQPEAPPVPPAGEGGPDQPDGIQQRGGRRAGRAVAPVQGRVPGRNRGGQSGQEPGHAAGGGRRGLYFSVSGGGGAGRLSGRQRQFSQYPRFARAANPRRAGGNIGGPLRRSHRFPTDSKAVSRDNRRPAAAGEGVPGPGPGWAAGNRGGRAGGGVRRTDRHQHHARQGRAERSPR